MALKNLTQGKAFWTGLFVGIVMFIGLNDYSMATRWHGIDLYGEPGIPFSFNNGGPFVEGMSWVGLSGDILFAFVMSFCIGVTFKSVWKEISN